MIEDNFSTESQMSKNVQPKRKLSVESFQSNTLNT